MLIGNQEYAHAPLIVEAYKTVPAHQVARLLEITAQRQDLQFDEVDKRIGKDLCREVGITADDITCSELFYRIQTLISVADLQKLRILDLSKPNLNSDESKFAAIQHEALEYVTNETDGAGTSPTRYYTHHPLVARNTGSSFPYAPKPLPKDWAVVTIVWPATKTVKAEWGKTAKQVMDVPAIAHPSGLFFAYEDAKKLQRFLRDEYVRKTGLVFGYAASEPVRVLTNGEVLQGLAAFYPGKRATRSIRKALPTANGPAGGGL